MLLTQSQREWLIKLSVWFVLYFLLRTQDWVIYKDGSLEAVHPNINVSTPDEAFLHIRRAKVREREAKEDKIIPGKHPGGTTKDKNPLVS